MRPGNAIFCTICTDIPVNCSSILFSGSFDSFNELFTLSTKCGSRDSVRAKINSVLCSTEESDFPETSFELESFSTAAGSAITPFFVSEAKRRNMRADVGGYQGLQCMEPSLSLVICYRLQLLSTSVFLEEVIKI